MTEKYYFHDMTKIFKERCQKFDLTLLSYDAERMKLKFVCNECHNEFDRRYTSKLPKILACPFCTGKISTYEFLTYKILQYNHINNILGYVIKDPIANHQHLDFYLKDKRMALEIQGNQHKNVKNGWYNNAGERDRKKAEWCKDNGIKLKYIYADGKYTIFEQLSAIFRGLKKPPYDYFDKNEKYYKEVISYLKEGHNLKQTTSHFNLGLKTVTRFIVTAGYRNYWDLYQQTRLEKLGLTNEKIIDWLRYHHFSHIEKELGITKKYVINYIFNSPSYPYSKTEDIKIETVCSSLWDKYLENHSKRNTAKHFMTDPETVEKYRSLYGVHDYWEPTEK